MAATHYNPLPYTPGIEDPVTYEEASALLARTGHKASVSTISRWVTQANTANEEAVVVVRVGRKDYVSYTAVLELHRDRTAVRLRASSLW